ncbi:hypothetical protein H696_04106 [Fonticula alba]|uniref:FH2 domain-containing protein n=1 Tax=Fonticula alba TaxID=691883 RepID=A0A058Z5Y1_FONAL|nr:hypothetical protein H696_04106 [Fonticula alba]KCV69699.1 hypothetical protein H696_04106 [Fonticula alba]|eukprot:XP_009496264.1 hypothetical protein H696_04106 [Fonticula alba]
MPRGLDIREYWKLLDMVVRQIIFGGKGIDPTFSEKYQIDINTIISEFADKSKLQHLEHAHEQLIKEKEKLDSSWADTFDSMQTENKKKIADLEATIGAKEAELLTAVAAAAESAPLKVAIEALKADKHDEATKALESAGLSLDLIKKVVPAGTGPAGPGGAPPPPAPGGGGPPPPPPPGPPPGMGGPPPPPPPGPPPGMGGPPPPPPPPPPPGMGGPPPPPPPPPGMGGPPPPPPPPGMGGPPPPPGMGPPGPPPPPGFGGPPPPPGFGPARPAGPKIAPKGKMRQFHWDKLPDRLIKNTFWSDRAIDYDRYIKLFNFSEFEDTFTAKQAAPLKEAADKPKKEEKISVLDSKRSYNCSIMLGNIKMPFEKIKLAVLSADDETLSDNHYVQLLNYVPNDEESKALEPFAEDPSKLDSADLFFLTMLTVPRYEQRLKLLLFRRTFPDKSKEIRQNLDAIMAACRTLKASKHFGTLLELILVFGNFMNTGTAKGNAKGFRLSSMHKLVDTKSANNQQTLMQYIITLLEQHMPELLTITEDLQACEAPTRITYSSLQADIAEVRLGLRLLENQLKIVTDKGEDKNPPENDRFYEVFFPFSQEAGKDFEDITKRQERLDSFYKEILAMYGEDPAMQPEEFFAQFNTFLQLFNQAREENKIRAARAAQAERVAAAQKEKELKRAEEEAKRKVITDLSEAQEDDKHLLDGILESLASGDAFGAKSRRRRNKDAEQAPELGAGADVDAMLENLNLDF